MKCLRTDHANEIALLAVMAVGVIVLLGMVIQRGVEGWDVAACLLVLQSIISAIKERWTQRSVDRMGDQLATSTPRGDGRAQPVEVVNDETAPVPVDPADPARR